MMHSTGVIDTAIQTPLTNTLRASLITSRQLVEESIAQTAISNGGRTREDGWPSTHHGRASVADHLALHHTCPTNKHNIHHHYSPTHNFHGSIGPQLNYVPSLHPYISCLRWSGPLLMPPPPPPQKKKRIQILTLTLVLLYTRDMNSTLVLS